MLLATDPPASGDYDFSSVRLAVSAGEALPPAHLPAVQGTIRRRDPRRHRRDRKHAHVHLESPGQSASRARADEMVPATTRRSWTTTARAVAAGEIGNLLVKGDTICAGYWNQPEKTQRHAGGRLAAHRRQVSPGRRRLLLAPRTCRRHAEGRRAVGEPRGSRADADRSIRRSRNVPWSGAKTPIAW